MSGEVCFTCAIKTDKHIEKPVFIHDCETCGNGSSIRYCDDCKKKLIYCKISRYYHEIGLKKCMWWKEK